MLRKLFQKPNGANDPQLYVIFTESHHSFMAEQVFKDEGIQGKLIASPSFLTTGCGLAWRSPADQEGRIRTVIQDHDLVVEKVVAH